MCVNPLWGRSLGFSLPPKRKPEIFVERVMEIQWVLRVLLLIVLLYPFFDVGGRWLHRWVKSKLELWDMMDVTCNSLNRITGLCEWGTECHCFREYMEKHANGNGHTDMKACYPSNKVTQIEPKVAQSMKELIENATVYGTAWVDRPNPGLVPEDTQPVEADEEEPFPGFSQHGG